MRLLKDRALVTVQALLFSRVGSSTHRSHSSEGRVRFRNSLGHPGQGSSGIYESLKSHSTVESAAEF